MEQNMNYEKKMKTNIRNEAVGKGLIAGGLIGIIANFLMMATRLSVNVFVPAAAVLLWAAIGVITASLFSLRKLGALTRRIRSLERVSGRMDDDNIRMVSADTAMGDYWLVTKDKTKYRLWTKDMLNKIALESRNPQAKQAVLVLEDRSGNLEKVIVAKSPRLEEKIAEWMFIPQA